MDTMQIVNQLDGLHKKYRQAMYLFAAPVVLLVIAYIGAPGMGAMAGTVVAVLMFAVPVGTIYASGRMSKINKEYQMIYKNAFVVSILNKTFSDVQVNWECGFTRQNVEQMGLLKLGNRFDSEDLIHGAYEGVSFDQADVTIKNVTGSGKNRHTTTYFKGRVFVFDLQKSDIRSYPVEKFPVLWKSEWISSRECEAGERSVQPGVQGDGSLSGRCVLCAYSTDDGMCDRPVPACRKCSPAVSG